MKEHRNLEGGQSINWTEWVAMSNLPTYGSETKLSVLVARVRSAAKAKRLASEAVNASSAAHRVAHANHDAACEEFSKASDEMWAAIVDESEPQL